MSENMSGFSIDGANLPYFVEGEQAILGAVLIDSDQLTTVMELLPTP